MVAMTHIGVYPAGKNMGVIAVVNFYLISGFVMTGLVRSYYSDIRKVLPFYMDRLMRIYPQYIFFGSLTLILFLWLGTESQFLKDEISFRNIFYNLTIIPLNFFMLNGIDKFMLIPPAWSLGGELLFYLVFPLILLAGLRSYFIAISFAIFCLAAMNIIRTDMFGYVLTPGVLFIFLSGSLLFDYVNGNNKERIKIIILYASMVVLFGLIIVAGKQNIRYNPEVFLGYLAGVPILFLLSLLKRRRVDEFLGNISYGIFLSHIFATYCFKQFKLFELLELKYVYIFYLMSIVMLGSVGFYLVEKPVLRFRKRVRQRSVNH